MIDKFEDLTRTEFIQYICFCINAFYFMYDYLTEKERRYITEFIDNLDDLYKIDKIEKI